MASILVVATQINSKVGLVSAAENLKRMGAPVPTILLKGFKVFQKAIDTAGDKNTGIGKDEDK